MNIMKEKKEWVQMKIYTGYRAIQNRLTNEQGITVVEIILVLVVLIGLVLIFKSQLTDLINDIFDTITSESSTV